MEIPVVPEAVKRGAVGLTFFGGGGGMAGRHRRLGTPFPPEAPMRIRQALLREVDDEMKVTRRGVTCE
jgi:hypothetical protein